MKIKRTLVKSEYNNTYVIRKFEVLESLPTVGEEYNGEIIKKICEYRDTDFTGEDKPRDDGYYRYYRIISENDEINNIAVWENYVD